MTVVRRYSELERIDSFEDRFNYLKLGGGVGHSTFGYDRYINQRFYASREWNDVRSYVLYRDNGCDLGIEGREIHVSPLIHHMNTMTPEDIMHGEEWILDPEYLITTTKETHNLIHYGGDLQSPPVAIDRIRGDTKLW